MRRRFIFSEGERRNRSGVPPRSAWVKLAGPLPVNVSLLGAPGLRPGAPFLALMVWPAPYREATQRPNDSSRRSAIQKLWGSLPAGPLA
jgi:hypothetical protein